MRETGMLLNCSGRLVIPPLIGGGNHEQARYKYHFQSFPREG